jgi:membrane protein YdbS with pleckstrin-like domain
MATGTELESAAQWLRPSTRLLTMRRAQVATLTAPVAVLAGVLVGLTEESWAGAAAGAAVLALGLAGERFARRRVGAWGYAERDDDLLVRRGILFSRMSVVPYGRMQFIDVTAGPFERVFGLATVRMHTAAAASDARIPGLEGAEAARLRDRLAQLGEARAAGV